MYPTLFLHVDSEALVEPAGLALVPPDHVHHTPAIIFAEIVKSPDDDKTWSLTITVLQFLFLNSPGRQPPNAALEESSAAVTRGNSVMLPTCLVPTHLTLYNL